MNMQRIIGLIILNMSMSIFGAGGAAVPSASQWIADDCGFKTQSFLIGGILTMIIGATWANIALLRKRTAAPKK